MKSIGIPVAIGFIILLTLGITQAYPLQGGTNGVNCTLFGAVKTPIIGTDPDAVVTDFALRLDMGLWGTENATYELVDADDKVFTPDEKLSRDLQPGRKMLVFVVPKGDLFKLFRVSPEGLEPFAINWWKTPKAMNSQIVLRYYGVVDWKNTPDGQYVTYEVGIYNNGTTPVVTSPENFTMMDQWAWDYYTLEGFSETELPPGNSVKTFLNFTDISPLSSPTFLIYDLFGSEPITIDIYSDMGPLSDEVVYAGSAKADNAPAAAPAASAEAPDAVAAEDVSLTAPTVTAPSTPATPIAPGPGGTVEKMPSLQDQMAKARNSLGGTTGSSGASSSTSGNTSTSIDAAKARLAKVRGDLKGST